MPVIYTPHFAQFFDDNGDPLSGGKLYTYAAGTTTPKATYTTAVGSVENTNPIILDSAGRAVLFVDGSYKFSLYDSNDVLVRTTDNIISFTATGSANSAYFEEFSGDGSTKDFTTASNLGTDEKLIMVFVDNGLKEHAANGAFASDTDWDKGSGWSIGSGVATAAGAISTAISQDAELTINAGQPYVVTMTITRDAGSLTPSVGGTAGTARSSAGTYSEIIIAGSTQVLAFTGASFTGTLDNVSVKPAASTGFDILPTSGYTINGTTLSLSSAPSTGTKNIQVWAPALLAGAASSSAASAASSAAAAYISETNSGTSETNAATSASNASTSETNAGNSATAAAASAVLAIGFRYGTSTSSVAIGTGEKTFTTQAGLGLISGAFVTCSDQTTPSNYVHGQVKTYSSTTLVVDVLDVGGSGTITAWNISPSAPQGSSGSGSGTINTGTTGQIAIYASGGTTLSGSSSIPSAILLTILQAVYPVGSIYINKTDSTNPATLLGFGTWVAFAAGRSPMGVGTGTDGSSDTLAVTAGATGGYYNNTLDTTQIPSHTHSIGVALGGYYGGGGINHPAVSPTSTINTGSTGGGLAHNNTHPYEGAYMWERTE